MKTTVVIPNYNGLEYLENCIESLRANPGDFCILVVDNGSGDGSVQYIRQQKDIKAIFLEHNTGFCHAVNLGVAAAETDYVILLNNDTTVSGNFVESLTKTIEEDEKIFSVNSKMVAMHNPEIIDGMGDYYTALAWAFAGGKGKKSSIFNKRKNIFSACGGASIYRKKIFEELGKLDEAHFAYLEDVDLGYRARINGYKNIFVPDAVCFHAGSAMSGSRYNKFKIELSGRNNVYLLWKNMPLLQLIINFPLLLIGFVIKIVFFSLKGFGKTYVKALIAGVRLCKSNSGKRLKFEWKNLLNYVIIQLELWANIFRRLYFF